MASKTKQSPLWPAALVVLLGLAWLGQEMSWIPTSLPLGPLDLILTGMALAYYATAQ